MAWAQRLKRVINIDVSICPECAGEARVITSIGEPSVIDKILKYLQAKGALQPHSELLPKMRAPATSDWFV
jgi:hypothetical protein